MAECEFFLREVVQRIEPSRTQKDGASRSHQYLREILASGHMARVIDDTYLSGSYARDAAIAPLDDVDIVFLINPTHWQNCVKSFLGLRPEPSQVLETFARAIRHRYDHSSVRIQRRSVCLHLNHLDVDVVPALPSNAESDTILVGDRIQSTWLESAPRKHEASASHINKMRGGLFKPLVKLLKSWNSTLPSTGMLKSFAIETMAAQIFRKYTFDTLQEGLLKFFDFMCHLSSRTAIYDWRDPCGMSFSWLWGYEVPDAAGTGHNLLANVTRQRMNRYLAGAAISSRKLGESIHARSTDAAITRIAEALHI